LRTVDEGWYVEYKGSVVSTKNIAKSLAAFANHYGGWIFYGVEGAKNGIPFAGSFPGIDQNNVPSLINETRNAAKDIITPSPYYEYRKLDGPCDEIGLPNGKSIIIVGVPIGTDSPYIHNDGRIYRRIADSSDPKPETDKTVLDNLWNRRQKAREKLTAFLEETTVLSKEEAEVTYLDIFLLPDPLGLANLDVKLKFNEFVKLMTDPPEPKPAVSIKFDNFFAMPNGVVARSVYENNPFYLTVTWKFYSNGFSVISVPFPYSLASAVSTRRWLSGYKHEKTFLDLLHQKQFDSSFVLDVNYLCIVLASALLQNRLLLEKSGIHGPYFAKAILHNIWRRIPFVDTEPFITFIQKHGIPVVQYKDEYTPAGRTFETLIKLQDINPIVEKDRHTVLAGDFSNVLPFILNGLGLPWGAIFDEGSDETFKKSFDEFFLDTFNRASEVSKQRKIILEK
jgi:hypothetical protein